MNTESLFALAFALAAPVWALLILAPGWHWTDRVAASALPLVPIIVVYLVLAVPLLPELWEAVRSPELVKWQQFMTRDDGASAIWAQIIAWDLFIGQWMYREGRRVGIHPLVMGPVLVLSILLSPFGVALFLVLRLAVGPLRAASQRRAGRDSDRDGDQPEAPTPLA